MRHFGRMGRRILTRIAAGCTLAAFVASAAVAAEAMRRGESGYPLPRFVSLSSAEVNVRMGPSFKHKVKWTFHKEGLPVEVVREFGNWRHVRDAEGEKLQDTMNKVTRRQLRTVDVLYESEDNKEGFRAFAEKRDPVWKGK